jgi:hypothetical protein
MAGAGGSADRTPTDYERQYEEDLERARALSLESLALEKFRLQKLQQQQSQYISSTPNGMCNIAFYLRINFLGIGGDCTS